MFHYSIRKHINNSGTNVKVYLLKLIDKPFLPRHYNADSSDTTTDSTNVYMAVEWLFPFRYHSFSKCDLVSIATLHILR